MTHQVDVSVYDGEDIVATLSARPVRLMPSGCAGVVHRGLVYPLYAGDVIRTQDPPVAKDACTVFAPAYAPIPYAKDDVSRDIGDLEIEEWYLESNRFGHYLVFDASENAAEQLVDAVERCGLGVRRWDHSNRPADNGADYDWFIRLGFDGTREECLRRVRELLTHNDSDAFDRSEATAAGSGFAPDALTALALGLGGPALSAAHVRGCIDAFDPARAGYLSWRLHEVSTRLGRTPPATVAEQLRTICTIARDEKELLSRLLNAHGDFLEGPASLAQRAIEAEFDRIDTDASWNSPDDALRRARASVDFLRHAAVLALSDEACRARVLSLTGELHPPKSAGAHAAGANVVAALQNLRRITEQVETLLAAGRHAVVELRDIRDGGFDVLAGLAPQLTEPSRAGRIEDLPFTVLPPDDLVEYLIDQVRTNPRYRNRQLDRRRIDVLTRLERRMSSAECVRYQGAFPSSGDDNLYMVLAIKQAGAEDEDAVAISPWKGEHATYVVRHDCGRGWSWRDVLSRPKREAIEFGARKLLFTSKSHRDIDQYQAMLDKLTRLLMCSQAEFNRQGDFSPAADRDSSPPPPRRSPKRKQPPPSVAEKVRRFLFRR